MNNLKIRISVFLILSIGLSTAPLTEDIDDLFAIFTSDNQEELMNATTELDAANELLIISTEKLNQITTEYDETEILTKLKEEEFKIADIEFLEFGTLYEDSLVNFNTAQSELELATENLVVTQNDLTSSAEDISIAQTDLELAKENLLAAENSFTSNAEALSSAREVHNFLKVEYDEYLILLSEKETAKIAEEMIVSDVQMIKELAQKEFDFIDLEFNQTLNILQQLDYEQIDSLI